MDCKTFIDWYASLAPYGETALVVRQKPVRPPAFHADGSPKCTFIPMLPDSRIDPSWAVYGNTGSFIIDRFPDGRPVAQARCVEFPLVLVLDDVGTKSRVPPIAPSWIMETSPGNCQYGYAFADDGAPTGAQFVALVRRLAELEYSDPGAGGLVRNFRLPGSINLKRDGFAARLVEFRPERQFTYLELCDAFGIMAESPDADTRAWSPAAGLTDDGADDVWSWLLAEGLVLGRPNVSGWAPVVCPNAAEHSDSNPEARYAPASRSFCCYHGHCTELDSRAFLDWVAARGGPKREPGLREELLAATMAAALEKLPTGSVAEAEAAEVLAAVQAREHQRLEAAELHDHWAYVVSDDGYFNLTDRTEVSRRGFNALYAHIEFKSPHGKRPIVRAGEWFDAMRQPKGSRALAGITYAPGLPALVERDGGEVYGNRWVNARPRRPVTALSAALWLAHLEALLPDPAERAALLDVLAFKLQRPDVKVNHGVLLAGHAGCGKDSLMAPFIRAVCGPFQRNRGLVQGDELNAAWGYHLECEVLVLNELRDSDAGARRALANKLKPLLAAPPEYLSVNRKGLRPYDALNRLLVVAYSNEQVPLVLDSSDRRWLVLKCSGGRMDVADAELLWSWYESGGYEAVSEYLYARDVSRFNPGAAPMRTRYWETLVSDGRSPAEELLIDMIENRTGEFAAGVIASPFSTLCSRIQAGNLSGIRIPKAALLHALAECGWLDCGLVSSREHPTKKQIYCAPQLAEYSKSDLRRMTEAPTAAGLRAVTG